MPQHLTLLSQYAFYPMHWEAFRLLCTQYGVRGSVITPPSPPMPPVHQQLGWVGMEEACGESFQPAIRLMPSAPRRRQKAWLREQLDDLRPDAIWVQEEPVNRWLLEVLAHYRRDQSPRIVCALAENIFRLRWWKRWSLARRWQRLDRIISVATPSIEGIRQAGMPVSVPADTLVAGAQSPPRSLQPMTLPISREVGDWVVGFAGRICPEKGWDVLLDAIESLPRWCKVAFAGDGPDAAALQRRLAGSGLSGRAAWLGLLPKADLWSFYRAVDCVATPHRTFPRWKEQFGGVLADAMAVGRPIVGSDSGSIPEVVGPAGLIVPEGDAGALAAAFQRLHSDPKLVQTLSRAGLARFEQEFSIPAYARKIAHALQLNSRSQAHGAAA